MSRNRATSDTAVMARPLRRTESDFERARKRIYQTVRFIVASPSERKAKGLQPHPKHIAMLLGLGG